MTDHTQESALVPLLGNDPEVAARNVREATDEAFAWQCLADALGDLVSEARDRARRSMTEMASEKQAVLADDGDRLGTVSLGGSDLKAEVLSKAKLVAWVKEHHPTEIVEDVNPAFTLKLMGMAVDQAREDGVIGGEVLPGIHVGEANPVMRIVKTARGRALGRELLARVLEDFTARTALPPAGS